MTVCRRGCEDGDVDTCYNEGSVLGQHGYCDRPQGLHRHGV